MRGSFCRTCHMFNCIFAGISSNSEVGIALGCLALVCLSIGAAISVMKRSELSSLSNMPTDEPSKSVGKHDRRKSGRRSSRRSRRRSSRSREQHSHTKVNESLDNSLLQSTASQQSPRVVSQKLDDPCVLTIDSVHPSASARPVTVFTEGIGDKFSAI